MKLRDWMNNNSALMTIGAVVVLILALAAIVYQLKGGRRGGGRAVDLYYYDVNTGGLFTAKSTEIPPIDTASAGQQPAGVRAFVYSCGQCTESERFIAYLETYTREAKAAMNQPPDPNSPSDVDPMQIEEQGHLVAAMPASPGAPILWVPAMSVQGTRVQEASTSARCPDPAQIKYCLP